ncbi:MAG: globin domain-containing protein [Pseudomonadota bacterium]
MTDAELCRKSYDMIVRRNANWAEAFYDRLFALIPEARALFPTDLEGQSEKLRATLQVALSMLESPEALVASLRSLGARHVDYGADADHYQLVSEVLIDTLAECAGDAWTPEVSAAWANVLAVVTGEMRAGAEEAAAA